MNMLLIKLKDGQVIEDKLSLHILIIEKYGIDIKDVINVGFKTKERIIWCNRRPH